MSTRKTHPSNVNKRLGLPDLPQKRRTPVEKKADDELLVNARVHREATANQTLQRVNDLEAKMKDDQEITMVSIAKPVCPAIVKSKSMYH